MKQVEPQPPLRCPCCGQMVEKVRDAKAIVDMLPMPMIDRTLAEFFTANIGHWLTTDALIRAVFGGRHDGGPLLAARNIAVRVHYLKLRLSGTPLMIESTPRASRAGRRMTWRDSA